MTQTIVIDIGAKHSGYKKNSFDDEIEQRIVYTRL